MIFFALFVLHINTCFVEKLLSLIQKGFPVDATIDQLEEFFADKGKVNGTDLLLILQM